MLHFPVFHKFSQNELINIDFINGLVKRLQTTLHCFTDYLLILWLVEIFLCI